MTTRYRAALSLLVLLLSAATFSWLSTSTESQTTIRPNQIRAGTFPSGTFTFPGPLNANGGGALNGNFTGPTTLSAAKNINNVAYATQFSGTDIFAQTNAAETAVGVPGTVIIPPGTYNSVTTALTCAGSRMKIIANGVVINFTASTGTAIKIQNVSNCSIEGPMQMNGPGTGTTSIAIQLGIGSGGNAQITEHNHIKDIQIGGFGKAFFGDGSAGGNGTFWNLIENVATQNGTSGTGNGIGFYLVPTVNAQFNNNTFQSCWGTGNVNDGWVLDGSSNSLLLNPDAESNGRYGLNFSANNGQTNGNVIVGGHWETNTTADFNWGSGGTASNLNENIVYGPIAVSSTTFVGSIVAGSFNYFQTSNTPGTMNFPGGTRVQYSINSSSPSVNLFNWFNNEAPPSGINNIFNIARSGADAGSITIGSPEYPVTTGNSGSQKAIPSVIASGTLALNTASITTATCDAGKSATATGTASTDAVDWSFNAAPSATNKYGAFLVVYAVPSANTVTFYTCNPSATTSTPTAMTVNYSVRRP